MTASIPLHMAAELRRLCYRNPAGLSRFEPYSQRQEGRLYNKRAARLGGPIMIMVMLQSVR